MKLLFIRSEKYCTAPRNKHDDQLCQTCSADPKPNIQLKLISMLYSAAEETIDHIQRSIQSMEFLNTQNKTS